MPRRSSPRVWMSDAFAQPFARPVRIVEWKDSAGQTCRRVVPFDISQDELKKVTATPCEGRQYLLGDELP